MFNHFAHSKIPTILQHLSFWHIMMFLGFKYCSVILEMHVVEFRSIIMFFKRVIKIIYDESQNGCCKKVEGEWSREKPTILQHSTILSY